MMAENDLNRPTLKEAIRLLKDPSRRMEYDFKCGHRDRQSLVERPVNLPREVIRDAWRRAFPNRYQLAQKFEAEAGELRAAGKLHDAIEKAVAAYDLDPMNDRLRFAVDSWTRESKARR